MLILSQAKESIMKELLGMLTSQLGIDETQATGGVGAILNLAKDKLGDGDFSQVLGSLGGGATEAMAAAPAAEGGGGIGGMLGAATSALGVDLGGLGKMAALAGTFKSLGLDASMITKFAPIVMGFVKDKGGDGVGSILEGLMK